MPLADGARGRYRSRAHGQALMADGDSATPVVMEVRYVRFRHRPFILRQIARSGFVLGRGGRSRDRSRRSLHSGDSHACGGIRRSATASRASRCCPSRGTSGHGHVGIRGSRGEPGAAVADMAIPLGSNAVRVTASVGVAGVPVGAQRGRVDELCRPGRCSAKRQGKNRVITPGLDSR